MIVFTVHLYNLYQVVHRKYSIKCMSSIIEFYLSTLQKTEMFGAGSKIVSLKPLLMGLVFRLIRTLFVPTKTFFLSLCQLPC